MARLGEQHMELLAYFLQGCLTGKGIPTNGLDVEDLRGMLNRFNALLQQDRRHRDDGESRD